MFFLSPIAIVKLEYRNSIGNARPPLFIMEFRVDGIPWTPYPQPSPVINNWLVENDVAFLSVLFLFSVLNKTLQPEEY
jgi:hypothetical protein